jgi:hypothetical protein
LNECFNNNSDAGSADANESGAGEDDDFIAVEIM